MICEKKMQKLAELAQSNAFIFLLIFPTLLRKKKYLFCLMC